MGNLSNLYISQSYTSLVHLGTDGPISAQPAGTLIPLQDGLGNSLGISLNNYGDINISGTISASNIPAEITSLPEFNAYTASANNRLNNLETTTASLNNSVSQLNASSASQQVSINALNAYTASTSTASIVTSITNLNQFTQSANVRLNNLETTSASVNTSISNLNTTTASLNNSVTNINAFTSSANNRLNNLESTSASVNVSIANLNLVSASQQVSINNLNAKTGSYATTGSNTFVGPQIINAALTASAAKISGLNYPTTDNGPKSYLQTDGAGTLSFQYVDTIFEVVKNGETTPLATGTPVYVSGSSGANPIVYRADASNPAKMPVIYVIQDAIASNATGPAIALGLLNNITTTGYTAGTEIYVAEGGGFSANRPSGSTSIVQPLGIITKEGSGTSGRGLILNPGPAFLPNIQNGYAWVGNSTNQPVAVATASFGGGGSTNTGSLLVTASAVDNIITFTKGDASTFQIQVSLSGSQGTIPLGTVSSSAQIEAYGIFVTTSSFNPYTASTNTSLNNLNAYTSSTNARLNNIELTTSSLSSSVGSLNAYTQSTNVRLTNIEAITASQQVSINALNVYTASQSTASIVTSITNLNQFTQSAGVRLNNLETTTASLNTSVSNINGFTSSADVRLTNIEATTASLNTSVVNINAFTQSAQASINSLNAKTGSYATTGSNTFIGNQTISGSMFVSQSQTIQLGDLQFGSVYKGTILGTSADGNVSFNMYGTQSADFHIGVAAEDFSYVQDLFIQPTPTGILFNAIDNTFSYSPFMSIGNGVGELPIMTRGLFVSSSLIVQNDLTASLPNGYVWVGNASGKTSLAPTSSFGGSINTGSFLVTASVNLNTITFTKADSSTFALTVNTGSGGGGGSTFPYAGTASISGSLQVTGSMSGLPITLSVVANTASIDMNAGNQFVLTLPSASTTHIAPSAIRAGQTINLLIKQQVGPGTGSVTFAPSILFPSGLDMQATATGSAIDLISMISFDTTNLMAANVKNLK